MLKRFCKKRIYYYLICTVLILSAFMWHFFDIRSAVINSSDKRLYFFYIGISLYVLTGISILYKFINIKREKLFLLFIGVFGAAYIFVTPALSVPDEAVHYISAYRISNFILGSPIDYKDGRVIVRKDDLKIEDTNRVYKLSDEEYKGNLISVNVNDKDENIILAQPLEEITYKNYLYGFDNSKDTGYKSESDYAVSGLSPVHTVVFAHLMPAIGITIARIFGLNSMYLLLFGRLLNLVLFAFIIYFAIKIIPFAKEGIIGITMFPMVIHTAASFSYDAFISAMIILYISLLLNMRYIYNDKKNILKKMVILLIIAICVAPCKIVYIPLFAVGLFLLPESISNRRKILYSALFITGLVISVYFNNFLYIARYVITDNNILDVGEEVGYTLSYIFNNIYDVIKVFYNTLIWDSGFLIETMVGARLGFLDISLDIPYIVIMPILIITILLFHRREDEKNFNLKKFDIYILITVCILSVSAIFGSMLLAYTPVNSAKILGVQGRYFIPILPYLFVTLRENKGIRINFNKSYALYFIIFLNAYAVIRLIARVSLRM